MKIFEKKKYPTQLREIYLFGKKIFSYTKWKKYDLSYGIIDYNTLPYTNDYKLIERKDPIISIIYPVYYTHNNFQAFNNLIDKYNKFSDEIKSKFEIIVVDDCSPYPIKLPEVNFNITLLKINKDIAWNNSGARNLGACYARTSRLILMDADWFVPEETLNTLLNIELNIDEIMPLAWTDDLSNPQKRVHPNLYCMNKQTFFNLNCYDETWCGFYGEDLFYRRYIMSHPKIKIKFKLINKPVMPNGEYITNDSHSLSRDFKKVKKELSKVVIPEHKKEILKFPWEYVTHYELNNISQTLVVAEE